MSVIFNLYSILEITDHVHDLILADQQISAKRKNTKILAISRKHTKFIIQGHFKEFSVKLVPKCLNTNQK